MAEDVQGRVRNKILFSIVICAIGLAAIVYLSLNVVRDLRLLNAARSDNVQWTLSQAEVEFLEFELELFKARLDSRPDLKGLRREFDVFYSRINTLEQASVYSPLQDIPEYEASLTRVRSFLNGAVSVIDGSDDDLVSKLSQLQAEAQSIRSNIRRLSNLALEYFAVESDARRNGISSTLTQLAAGITALMFALLLLVLYLGFLNAQNVRRRAQVIEASQRMNVVMGTSLDGVIVSNDTGKILDFNAAAEQIFGVTSADAMGKDLVQIVVPDHHADAHNAGMERMRQNGERRVVGKGRVRLEAKRSNGEIFPVELAIQSANTKDGEIFIAFLRDISQNVKAEEELMDTRDRALAGEKAKTDFLATMSHEIRTPLNGLLGNLSLLQDTELNSKQSRYIGNMETSGKLLMSHVSDVLDITKYDAGKLLLRPVDMDLSALMQDIIDNQSGAATAHNTKLEWAWTGAPADWVRADRDRIQHIVMNLVGNAVKFTRDGEVSVSLTLQNDPVEMLEIVVRDTGIGIPPDQLEHVFDDFFTGDSSYDRQVGGTGLGLGIVRRFVTALGGTIELDSEPDQGSTFTVRFPVKQVGPRSKPTPAPPVERHLVACNVLLVEDNEINREVAREMIGIEGHQVTEANNGQQAVDLAQVQQFDLILMDISMPVMDGRTATRAIRAGGGVSAQAPIVALTANSMRKEQEAFIYDGMQEILTKPLSRDALRDVLYRYCSAPQSEPSEPSSSNEHLQSLVDTLGPEKARNVIDRFETEVEETLSYFAIWQALSLDDVAKRAHKVAGSAAILGVTSLRESLLVLENAAKQDDILEVGKAIDELPSTWKTAKQDLKV